MSKERKLANASKQQSVSAAFLHRDLDLMNFETKVRVLMAELMAPMMEKQQKDRELIYVQEKEHEKSDERINLLERAVFQTSSDKKKKTLFDEMDEKLLAMSIEVKSLKEDSTMALSNFITEAKNEFFDIKQTLTKTESYKDQIETSKASIKDLADHTQLTIEDLRTNLEGEKLKTLKEFTRVSQKVANLNYIVESLPTAVKQCEVMCKNSQEVTLGLKGQMGAVMLQNVDLENNKCPQEQFNVFEKAQQARMANIENTFDKLWNKSKTLENWIDIYMPLRIQHQITETVKDSFSAKGKYMLGIVDNLMCNKFRDRVFADVGSSELEKRCLSVIKALQLEADALTDENKFAVMEAHKSFDKWQVDDDGQLAKPDTAIVAVDMTQHLGEQNQELADMLKAWSRTYVDQRAQEMKAYVQEQMKEFTKNSLQQLDTIEQMVIQKGKDNDYFQTALKEEMETQTAFARKTTHEHLLLIKGITETIKHIKDQQTAQRDREQSNKLILTHIMDYFQITNSLMNINENEKEKESQSINANASFLTAINSKKGLNNNYNSQLTMYDKEKQTTLERANDCLKKLQISMFRNTMSNKKLKNLGETHSSNIFGTGKSHLNQTSKKSQEATNTVLHSFTKLNSPSHQSLAPYQSHSNFEGFPTIKTDKSSRRKEGLRNSYHNSHIASPQNDLMNIMNVNEIAIATNHYIDTTSQLHTSTLSHHKSKIEIDINNNFRNSNEDLNFSVDKRERQTTLLPSFKDKQMRLDQSLVTSSAMNKSSMLESDPQFRVGWPKTQKHGKSQAAQSRLQHNSNYASELGSLSGAGKPQPFKAKMVGQSVHPQQQHKTDRVGVVTHVNSPIGQKMSQQILITKKENPLIHPNAAIDPNHTFRVNME